MTWLLARWRWLGPLALAAALLVAEDLIRSSGYRAGYAAAANAYQEAARMKDREYRRREAEAEAKVNALASEHLADEARIGTATALRCHRDAVTLARTSNRSKPAARSGRHGRPNPRKGAGPGLWAR